MSVRSYEDSGYRRTGTRGSHLSPNARFTGCALWFFAQGVRPCRAKTKGKVERPFRYIRQDFFLGRSFDDIDDLNQQFTHWRENIANARVHGTTGRIIHDAYREEQASLRLLPAGRFNDVLSMERRVTRDGMVSVDGNLYSVPDGASTRCIQVERTATELRILDGQSLLAVHPLQLGKNQRQVIEGHRSKRQSMTVNPIATDVKGALEREGDTVAQRRLDIYDAIGASLAKEELA